MDNNSENGIAKADDFRAAAEARAFEEPRRIVLPHSGFPCILRRPRPIAFALTKYGLPSSLALKIQGVSPEKLMDEREERQVKLLWVEMFAKMFVDPELSLDPSPAQIHLSWVLPEDQIFLIKWAVGEVDDKNVDLASFRGEREPDVAGASGEAVGMPPEPTPVG